MQLPKLPSSIEAKNWRIDPDQNSISAIVLFDLVHTTGSQVMAAANCQVFLEDVSNISVSEIPKVALDRYKKLMADVFD
ncbi:hypothetical protein [Pseudohongiella nitratireducens]|uniref:hypothetical protein n=1 Tax=Pseudohongiella nitratireducens TaxID=1768907 RepID=UPI0030EC93D3|tara:strand:+ start:5704 stop:5940 length:237 start_codon:yes stop_codon:yes gene_type:complete